MGLDCPHIHEVIRWGPSSDVESYIQETGRAGRDGYLSHVILFMDLGIEATMMVYSENNSRCRRQLLFCDFDEEESDQSPCEL